MYVQRNNLSKMKEFLFEGKPYPYKDKNYRFLLIQHVDSNSEKTVFSFLEEMIPDSLVLNIDSDYLLFYFFDYEYQFSDLFSSISDDFGISLRVYASGRLSSSKADYFWLLYQTVKKYLDNSAHLFLTNADLISEIVKKDVKKLREIKAIILNRIYEDSQMEKLILAMFNNNLNVTQTAKAVYMHRNTIINKLEFIRLETGLNLQNFKDATCLYWLMKIK